MEHCASCERELAARWKFCIYCGQPITASSGPLLSILPAPSSAPLFSAVAVETGGDHNPPPRRKNDVAFGVGVGMGVLGLVLIVFAAVQIYSSQV